MNNEKKCFKLLTEVLKLQGVLNTVLIFSMSIIYLICIACDIVFIVCDQGAKLSELKNDINIDYYMNNFLFIISFCLFFSFIMLAQRNFIKITRFFNVTRKVYLKVYCTFIFILTSIFTLLQWSKSVIFMMFNSKVFKINGISGFDLIKLFWFIFCLFLIIGLTYNFIGLLFQNQSKKIVKVLVLMTVIVLSIILASISVINRLIYLNYSFILLFFTAIILLLHINLLIIKKLDISI